MKRLILPLLIVCSLSALGQKTKKDSISLWNSTSLWTDHGIVPLHLDPVPSSWSLQLSDGKNLYVITIPDSSYPAVIKAVKFWLEARNVKFEYNQIPIEKRRTP